MCWYYITAGFVLWVVDYYLRLNRVFNNSVVLTSCRVAVPNSPLTDSGGIIELSYVVKRSKLLVDSDSIDLKGDVEMSAIKKEQAYTDIAEVDLDDSVLEGHEKQRLTNGKKSSSNELNITSERCLKHRLNELTLNFRDHILLE